MNNSFRTEVQLLRSNIELDYQSSMVFLGSCFSDHIGGLLQKNKFPVLLNPFGVLYNPASIAQSINIAIEQTIIEEADLTHHNHMWHSFSFHGSFSDSNFNVVIEKTNKALQIAHSVLKNADVVFVTFGTAWVYQWKSSNQIVSNCHKIPANQFNRFRLSVSSIVETWKETIAKLWEFNPKLKIVFTVSPIRHLKDGMHENQLSKSTLLLAIDELVQLGNEKISYFPSYEIVQDDLRDYRFYSNDMVHISEIAVEYIFDKFKSNYFSKSTIQLLSEVQAILLLNNHRILTNNQTEIEKFANASLKKINLLEEKFPYIKFELEKTYFQNLIN